MNGCREIISVCFAKVICCSQHQIENVLIFHMYLLKCLPNRQKYSLNCLFEILLLIQLGCVVQRISVPVGLKMNITLKPQTVIWVPAHWILLITFTNSSYGAGIFFKNNCYNLHSNFHSSKECNVITESRIVALISGDTSS